MLLLLLLLHATSSCRPTCYSRQLLPGTAPLLMLLPATCCYCLPCEQVIGALEIFVLDLKELAARRKALQQRKLQQQQAMAASPGEGVMGGGGEGGQLQTQGGWPRGVCVGGAVWGGGKRVRVQRLCPPTHITDRKSHV